MSDHLAKRLAMRLRKLVETADARPVDLPVQALGCVLGPFPIVLAQCLFGHILDDRWMTGGQTVLHSHDRVDGAIRRRQPFLVHDAAQHQVTAHVPEPEFVRVRLTVLVQVDGDGGGLLFNCLNSGPLFRVGCVGIRKIAYPVLLQRFEQHHRPHQIPSRPAQIREAWSLSQDQ